MRRSLCRYFAGLEGGNFTSFSNKMHGHQAVLGRNSSPIPRRDRESMTQISVIHEGRDILVAGRNRCNGFNSNQFLIASKREKECIIVDAADDWMDDWVTFVNSSQLTVKCIFLTHLHMDNIMNLSPLLTMLEARGPKAGQRSVGPESDIAIWANDRSVPLAYGGADEVWLDLFAKSCAHYGRGDLQTNYLRATFHPPQPQDMVLGTSSSRSDSFIELGRTLCFHIATPGHSPGHQMLHLPEEKLLFTGDVLYFNNIGRVDLPNGQADVMAQSLRKLEDVPDNTVLLPGHGKLSTMGRERKHNGGLQRVYEYLAAGAAQPRVGSNEGPL